MSTSLKDKSQPDGECTEGIPSTVTIMAVVALLDSLNSLFEAAQHWKQAHSQEPLSSETSTADKPRGLSLVTSLGHLQGLLEFCLSWLGSKLNTLLLTWNLKPFFLLTQWDMPCLVSSVERTAELLRPLCSSHSNVWSSLQMQWQDVQRLLGNLEVLAVYFVVHNSIQCFSGQHVFCLPHLASERTVEYEQSLCRLHVMSVARE